MSNLLPPLPQPRPPMKNLRELANSDLKTTLEGEWSLPVRLCDPAGIWYDLTADNRMLTGQVLYDIVRLNPENGDRMTVPVPVVSLRRDSLVRIPVPGENWIVEIPSSPYPSAPRKQFSLNPTRPPEGGASLGFIRLYLQEVEQS